MEEETRENIVQAFMYKGEDCIIKLKTQCVLKKGDSQSETTTTTKNIRTDLGSGVLSSLCGSVRGLFHDGTE